MDYKTCNCNERRKLLKEIGKIDFTLKDLHLYLDTHPYDMQAMELFKKYTMIKKKLVKEYTEMYGPLCLDTIEDNMKDWKWALQDWPWEGGYN